MKLQILIIIGLLIVGVVFAIMSIFIQQQIPQRFSFRDGMDIPPTPRYTSKTIQIPNEAILQNPCGVVKGWKEDVIFSNVEIQVPSYWQQRSSHENQEEVAEYVSEYAPEETLVKIHRGLRKEVYRERDNTYKRNSQRIIEKKDIEVDSRIYTRYTLSEYVIGNISYDESFDWYVPLENTVYVITIISRNLGSLEGLVASLRPISSDMFCPTPTMRPPQCGISISPNLENAHISVFLTGAEAKEVHVNEHNNADVIVSTSGNGKSGNPFILKAKKIYPNQSAWITISLETMNGSMISCNRVDY